MPRKPIGLMREMSLILRIHIDPSAQTTLTPRTLSMLEIHLFLESPFVLRTLLKLKNLLSLILPGIGQLDTKKFLSMPFLYFYLIADWLDIAKSPAKKACQKVAKLKSLITFVRVGRF